MWELNLENDLSFNVELKWISNGTVKYHKAISSGSSFSTFAFRDQTWLLTGIDSMTMSLFNKSFKIGFGEFEHHDQLVKISTIKDFSESDNSKLNKKIKNNVNFIQDELIAKQSNSKYFTCI